MAMCCWNIDLFVLGSDFLFTGIVEEVGKITYLQKNCSGMKINICADKILSGLNIGDSVAVNGICLTVVDIQSRIFAVDIMNETVRNSAAEFFSVGKLVNLERAMAASGRFNGHVVTGHIDGVGVVAEKRRDGISISYKIETSPKILKYVVKKGSVCVDGISLTVVSVDEKSFTISIIPHTLSETTAGGFAENSTVNIEADILAKHVEKLLNVNFAAKNSSILTKQNLINWGFFG